ncbi:MAG TPA: glycosyltransferase [Thermoleophilaceae bacterium]|jgi:GT2 family glycosyltransferase
MTPRPSTAPRVSVIVPTWNAGDVLGPCLDSVLAQQVPGGFETIVVDNASTDGTADLLREYADRARVVTNERNLRFAGANNQAAADAAGRVLVFLNSDTELLGTDTLARLADAAEPRDVAIAGPLLVNPDGSLQPSCAAHPSILRAALVATGAHRLLPDATRARLAPERWSHAHARDTAWVMGAAMAMRAEVFRELGGFWPTMYAEEQDIAFRARNRGFRVRFDPSARVMHVGNHSLRKRWSDPERSARVAAAELVLLATHYPRWRAAAIRAIAGAGLAARSLAHRLLGHRERAREFRAMTRVYAGRSKPHGLD